MSLTKAQLTTFASTICHAQHDTTTFSQIFNDVMDELARKPSPPFVDCAFEAISDGESEYSYEATMNRPLYIFRGDRLLTHETIAGLEAYSKTWESDTGTPIAYTLEGVDGRKYRLYPIPDADGAITGANWAAGYPDDALALIFAEDRSTDIEDYYVLPVVFDCLAREFAYPSDHQDVEYAKVLNKLATVLYTLAGVA